MACQVTRSFANRACLDALGRQLQPSRDTGELTAQMQRLWQDLPQGVISDLIESMPRRISACIAARGFCIIRTEMPPSGEETGRQNCLRRLAGRRAVLLARWIVRSVPLEIDGSSGHDKVPTCGKPSLERPGRPRGERGLKDRATSTCGPHSNSFNDTSRRPFLNGLPGAIFRQDNVRPHTARVAQDFLHHFQTLLWPARSPDFPPVEHVWDQLKRQCHRVTLYMI
ncbi:transposable element Tcb2 transposase [Trichonephila clavipes]|nr:transposable element Tcb2 transposase [Trichonephila clavipes]